MQLYVLYATLVSRVKTSLMDLVRKKKLGLINV
jgi:hypothetical protein